MSQPDNGAALPAQAIAALRQGNKIEAIKIVRAERGLGLKEAKDAVDAYAGQDPQLKAAFAASSARSKRSLGWIVAASVAALIAWLVFAR